MTVTRTPIKLASVSGNDVVVASGVAPGDTVVTAGVHLLEPGQKVKLLGDPVGLSAIPSARHETRAAAPLPLSVNQAKPKS
jgi:hypothetical protein